MSAILHCVITSIENDRLRQLIDNMRFNKKHYEDYVKERLMEEHTIYMDMDMVDYFELLDDLPYKKAKVFLKEIEDNDYLECELGGITWNEDYGGRRELYIKVELDGLCYKKEYSFVCNSPFDITFVENYIQDIRETIDRDYDEEYMEFDTCETCQKIVVANYDDDVGYSIANCDVCNAMCCRECLDKHSTESRTACPKCI